MNTSNQSTAELLAQILEQEAIINKLREERAEILTKVDELEARYQRILEDIRLAKHRLHGPSSEAHPAQHELFDFKDDLVESLTETTTVNPTKIMQRKPKRQLLPAYLPRKEVRHEVEVSQCPCCGDELHSIGEDVSEKLIFIPAKVSVERHIRPKVICRTCDKQATESKIYQAPMPATAFPKSMATPSLVANLITMKFQFGLPVTRIATLFESWGIHLKRRTIAQWNIQGANALEPLWEHLRLQLLKEPCIHADETPVKVIDSDQIKNYMWVYCSGADSPQEIRNQHNIVLFDYQPGRASQYPINFLDGYLGYLHVDGYQGYNATAATLVGCWAHARRKFMDAKKVQGNDEGGIRVALNSIGKLYGIEQSISALPAVERYQMRQEKAVPELNKFKNWLDKTALRVPQKSALGKAVHYCLGQWEKLERYLLDGHLEIDNNRAERAIRPFVIGRKGWLFCKSAQGARSSCVLYSLVETAKANGLDPTDYLTACFERLAQKPDDLDSLLPWNMKL